MISFTIPEDEEGWASLINKAEMTIGQLHNSLDITLENWENVQALVNYHDPFENQVRKSLRALQQMVYDHQEVLLRPLTPHWQKYWRGAKLRLPVCLDGEL